MNRFASMTRLPPDDERHPRPSRWAVLRQSPALWTALLGELLLLVLAGCFGDLSADGNAARFVALVLTSGLCFLVAVAFYQNAPPATRPTLLWGVSIALRAAVLLMPPGQDLWRHLWDGKIQTHGFNPYLLNPDSPALSALRENWWNFIHQRNVASMESPGGEWIFAHLFGTAHWYAIGPVYVAYLFKAVFALADIGTVWLLLKLNTGSARYRATAWYAWNPAVVIAFAGAGHYDSLMVFALTVAAWLLHRANPLGKCKPAWDWVLASSAMLGIAIAIEPAPLVLLPVWAAALRRRSLVLGLSLAIPLALALPYGGVEVVTRAVTAYLDQARFNDLLCWGVERFLWTNPGGHNLRYLVLLVLALVGIAWRFRNEWRTGALWAMGAALVFAPVLHPWYIVWVLPFACWQRAQGWFVFALTATLALIPWGNGVAGVPPIWVRLVALAPAVGWWLATRRYGTASARSR